MKAGQGTGIAAIAVGAMFVYAGARGFSILKAAQNVIRGTAPGAGQKVAKLETPIASSKYGGGTLGVGTIHSGHAQDVLHKTATDFGWGSGQQWQDLQSLEMGEAGFDPHNKNPSSGAYGLAQALNHGTANTRGTESNMYGNYGLTDEQNRRANSGDAGAQALWMCRYIREVYTNPSNAWAKWQSRSPHWY